MSETGAVMRFFSSVELASFHTVLMLIESLPTGIVMPSAGQSSMPTACTAAYKIGAVAGNGGRGHPVGGEIDLADVADLRGGEIGQRLADREARRSGGVVHRDGRAFAHRHRFAGVDIVRTPR